MRPVQAAGGVHAGLVEAGYLGLGRQIADELIDRFEPAGAIGAEVCQGALTEALATEEVTHDLGEPVGGQQLVVAQIDGRALDAGTILHGGCGFRRERGAVEAAAGAGFDFSLVLGDLQLRLGQIEELPAFDAVRSLFRQGTSAARAALDRVTHGAIRHCHQAQRPARMSGLAVGGPITGWVQTLGLGLLRPSEDGGRLLLWESFAAFSSSAWTLSHRDRQSRRRAAFSAFSVATSAFNWSSSRENSQSIRAAASAPVPVFCQERSNQPDVFGV